MYPPGISRCVKTRAIQLVVPMKIVDEAKNQSEKIRGSHAWTMTVQKDLRKSGKRAEKVQRKRKRSNGGTSYNRWLIET